MNKLKKNSMYLLFLSLILLLAACTSNPTPDNDAYIAKASDFEDNVFTSSQNQSLGLFGNDLRITGIYDKEAKRKSSLDSIISSISGGTGKQIEKIFTNAKVKTEGAKYYITADEGVSLTFTKVGERIIKDEEGIEYSTPVHSK